MRLRSEEFRTYQPIYQRYQSENNYQPYKQPLPQKLLLIGLIQPFDIPFSKLSIIGKILPSLKRFMVIATNKNKAIITANNSNLDDVRELNISATIPPKALLKSSNLDLITSNRNFNNSIRTFKSSLITRLFIGTDNIFNTIKRFSFDVVVKPRFEPVRETFDAPIVNSKVTNP